MFCGRFPDRVNVITFTHYYYRVCRCDNLENFSNSHFNQSNRFDLRLRLSIYFMVAFLAEDVWKFSVQCRHCLCGLAWALGKERCRPKFPRKRPLCMIEAPQLQMLQRCGSRSADVPLREEWPHGNADRWMWPEMKGCWWALPSMCGLTTAMCSHATGCSRIWWTGECAGFSCCCHWCCDLHSVFEVPYGFVFDILVFSWGRFSNNMMTQKCGPFVTNPGRMFAQDGNFGIFQLPDNWDHHQPADNGAVYNCHLGFVLRCNSRPMCHLWRQLLPCLWERLDCRMWQWEDPWTSCLSLRDVKEWTLMGVAWVS